MIRLILIIFSAYVWQDTVPYKPMDEFEVKLNFEFRERHRGDPNKVELDRTQKEVERSRGSAPLPYLFLNFRALKLSDTEVRARVLENNSKVAFNKKIDTSSVLKLELGFTDDIKDRVGPYEYTILLLNENKEPLTRVVIYFQTDGTYLVNGQMRGKI